MTVNKVRVESLLHTAQEDVDRSPDNYWEERVHPLVVARNAYEQRYAQRITELLDLPQLFIAV